MLGIECHCAYFKALIIASLTGAVFFILKLFGFGNSEEKERLRQVLKKKQAEREADISRLRSLYKLDDKAQPIVKLEWKELVEKLQSRELSATEVLHAYIAKAIEVNDKCNPITDFIPQAHIWAKELDSLGKVKGPFHGVPICIKDDYSVEGMDTVHGYVKQLYKPAKDSAALVKVLQDLGCVPFAKTNVPQTLFTYGSDNPVFGKTLNALNPKLSPGGSSSGTGALVGSHGCMFGTGSDIGGSLRIPAHFNGVSSLKPTGGRITDKGVVCSLPNLAGLTPSMGVIGIKPTIVADVFQQVLKNGNQSSYDPLVVPIPWNESLFTSTEKLRIGYYTSMPYFPPMGDTEEVVLKAKAALESLGHTLVPFEMPDGYKFMNTFGKLILADGGKHFANRWKDEQVTREARTVWLNTLIPNRIQKLLGKLMTCKAIPFLYSPRTAAIFGAGAVSSTDVWAAHGEKKALIDNMVDDWQELKLDCMLCPSFPFPAPDVNAPGLLVCAPCYTIIWNLVDFPAGIVPFGVESGKKLEAYDDEGDVSLKLSKKFVKNSTGAPIGVQIVGLPFKEEIVLRVMKELEGKIEA